MRFEGMIEKLKRFRNPTLSGGMAPHDLARICLLVMKYPQDVDEALATPTEEAAEKLMELLNNASLARQHGFMTFFPQIEPDEIVALASELRKFDLSQLKQDLSVSYFQGKVGRFDFPVVLFDLLFPEFKPASGEKILIPYAENSLGLALSLAVKFSNCEVTLWFQEMETKGIISFLFGDLENVGSENLSPRSIGSSFSEFDWVIAFPPFGRKLSKEDTKEYSVPRGFSNPRSDADFLVQRLLTETYGKSRFIVLVPELFMHSHGSFKEIRDHLSGNHQLVSVAHLSQKVLYPYTRASLNLLHFTNSRIEPETDVELTKVETTSQAREREMPGHEKLNTEKRFVSAQSLRDSEVWNFESIFAEKSLSISPRMETIKLDEVVEDIFRGAVTESPERAARKETLRVVGLTEMDHELLDVDSIKEAVVGLNTPPKRYLLRDSDIVVTCRGTVTKVSLIKISGDVHAIPSSNVAVIRANQERVDALFLFSFLMTPAGREALQGRQSGVSQKALSVRDLRTIEIPNLPLAEQQKIGKDYRETIQWYETEKKRLEREYGLRLEALNRMMGVGSTE